MISSFVHTPTVCTGDCSVSNWSMLFHLCVQRSSITTLLHVRSMLLFCNAHICSRSVLIISKQSESGGREGRTDDWRISVELWMSHCSKSYLPLSLKYLYHCCYLKFLWTPQGTVIYGTIKYNLHGYSFLNHKPTNCFDMLERAGWNSSVTYLWFVCVGGCFNILYISSNWTDTCRLSGQLTFLLMSNSNVATIFKLINSRLQLILGNIFLKV